MPEDRTGKVQTVRGLIEPTQLGPTLMHEHLLVNQRPFRFVLPEAVGELAHADSTFRPDLRQAIVSDPPGNRDNMALDNEQDAVDELTRFRLRGGGTIVDATTRGMGRDPKAIYRISSATGLNVTMGTGYYVAASHPPDMSSRTEDELFDEMVREIEVGVEETGIHCGHIGEIGVDEFADNELKVLRAASRTQRRTGAMMTVHQMYVFVKREGAKLADVIEDAGGDLHRTVFCHMDGSEEDFDLQVSLLERGITLEYDVFGLEQYWPRFDLQWPQDQARVRGVARLIEAGWASQIVLSQDICMKMMLVKNGGWGYAHILDYVVPRLRLIGVTDVQITTMLVDNPRRLLAFAKPQQ